MNITSSLNLIVEYSTEKLDVQEKLPQGKYDVTSDSLLLILCIGSCRLEDLHWPRCHSIHHRKAVKHCRHKLRGHVKNPVAKLTGANRKCFVSYRK